MLEVSCANSSSFEQLLVLVVAVHLKESYSTV